MVPADEELTDALHCAFKMHVSAPAELTSSKSRASMPCHLEYCKVVQDLRRSATSKPPKAATGC
jgi:hypothetical protein